jgi:hypothetical protein
MHLLSRDPNVKITSTGGSADKGAWIKIFAKEPVPLFQILNKVPSVQEITRKGQEVNILIQPVD